MIGIHDVLESMLWAGQMPLKTKFARGTQRSTSCLSEMAGGFRLISQSCFVKRCKIAVSNVSALRICLVQSFPWEVDSSKIVDSERPTLWAMLQERNCFLGPRSLDSSTAFCLANTKT